jgi:hypothetical protein
VNQDAVRPNIWLDASGVKWQHEWAVGQRIVGGADDIAAHRNRANVMDICRSGLFFPSWPELGSL